MFRKLWNFCKKVVTTAIKTFKEFVVEIVQNAEATVILCAASIGVSAVVARYAMVTSMPAFLDAPMVIPVLSVMVIIALTMSMQWRLGLEGA